MSRKCCKKPTIYKNTSRVSPCFSRTRHNIHGALFSWTHAINTPSFYVHVATKYSCSNHDTSRFAVEEYAQKKVQPRNKVHGTIHGKALNSWDKNHHFFELMSIMLMPFWLFSFVSKCKPLLVCTLHSAASSPIRQHRP